jgi:1-deoxy-D-xylulose-5-phosphate synthase
MTEFLETISCPADVRGLSIEERVDLADEVRRRIIEVVCATGGHLASSLGVVELTIALLSVYEPPRDKVIWDVGHQCYPYKLLTGRCRDFHTVRQSGGLSGFTKRSESPCDAFGAGHSSTSISAALGFARARDLAGRGERVVAVIGDGAMTGGMALEGLNNLGHSNTDMTVVLNDNKMSISRNVGGLSSYLARILTDSTYNRMRNEVWNLLGKIPSLGERMRRAARVVGAGLKKGLVAPATVFDEFGVRYIGPLPGHDLPLLTGVMGRVAELPGPVLVHVITQKGKGYSPAEEDATGFHGVSGSRSESPEGERFTDAFSDEMVRLGDEDGRVCAITAAMPDGTGLVRFAEACPDRFFDVGIAEQHAVTFACGLAFGGMKPVVAVYSTFMQRAVDQVIHDAALQRAPVVIAMDRAGLVGPDGPTHHGAFDISIFRCVPDLRIIAPRDCTMLRRALRAAVGFEECPTLLRYPRGLETPCPPPPEVLSEGVGQLLREGSDALIVAAGSMVSKALEAAESLAGEGIGAAVLDPIWLKPLPVEQIRRCAAGLPVVTVEEGSARGGVGEQVAAALEDGGRVTVLGLPDEFSPHGFRDGLLESAGLGTGDIAGAVRRAAGGE